MKAISVVIDTAKRKITVEKTVTHTIYIAVYVFTNNSSRLMS